MYSIFFALCKEGSNYLECVNSYPQECITKLELETLEQGIILELLYAIGFGFISLIITRVGKFPILCKYQLSNFSSISSQKTISISMEIIPSYQLYKFC